MRWKTNTIKRILSMIMVIAMVLSMIPATVFAATTGTRTIYLNAGGSSLWDQADAWFQAWVWGAGDAWHTFADEDADGIYEIEVPAGSTGMKVIRRGPSHAADSWDDNQKWNDTGDVSIGTQNYYTITGWNAGNGVWSTYAGPSYTIAGGLADSKTDAGFFGTRWDVTNTANDMTKNTETGLYEKVFTDISAGTYEFKVLANHAWTYSWGSGTGNASVTVNTNGSTVTVTFNEETKEVAAAVVEGNVPAEATTVYLKPSSDWLNDGAWFAARVWKDSSEQWYKFADEDKDGIYQIEVAAGYSNIIFVRMDSAKTELSWDSKWNQSQNETIPSDGKNLFTLDAGWGGTGTWSKLNSDEPAETVAYEATLHFYDAFNWGSVCLYTWNDSGNPTGAWPGSGVSKDANGFYTMVVSYEAPVNSGLNFIYNSGSDANKTADQVLAADAFKQTAESPIYKAEKWIVPTEKVNGLYGAQILDSGDGIAISPVVNDTTVTFNYKNADANAVYVAGDFNGWSATANPMTKNAQGIWSTTVQNVKAGVRQYKFVVDGNWILDPVNSWVVKDSDNNENSEFLITGTTSPSISPTGTTVMT